MFYNVAKATKEKEKKKSKIAGGGGKNRVGGAVERRKKKQRDKRLLVPNNNYTESDMDPGLWGRNYHAPSRARSRNQSRGPSSRAASIVPGDYFLDEDEDRKEQAHEEFGDESESEYEGDFNSVPKCMLGKPLKDKHSGQDTNFIVINTKFGKQMVYRFSKEKSLFILGPDSSIRKLILSVFTHQYFEIFILLTIVTNCVFMALSKAPKESEYVFAAIYTFEMIVKILAKGFIMHKYSYLRNYWNWLDFIVVVLGYVTMSPSVSNLDSIRTFRVLRALKTISTVKGLKAMVNTLLKSMKMMTDVLILTLFFIAIFALVGLQLFLGALHSRCVKLNPNNTASLWDQNYRDLPGNVQMEHICGNVTNSWQCDEGWVCMPDVADNDPYYVNYDNFLYAMLTSLQVCTLDYWEIVFNNVIAAKGEFYMIYFLLCVFLGPFYLLNLVLAVVSASYEMEVNGNPDMEMEREKVASIRRTASTYSFNGDECMEFLEGASPVQDVDGELQYTVDNSPPTKKRKAKVKHVFMPPELGENPTCWKRFHFTMYKIVSSSCFEGFITACILLNTLLMTIEHHNMSSTLENITEIFNYVFTGIFIIEMGMKLIAYTLRGYMQNKWNVFDGLLVIVSVVDILLVNLTALPKGTLKMLKVFRLMRILKLAQSWKTMGQLLSTIASSMGALGNVTVILGLIIYIFSVVGMQLFGSKYREKEKMVDSEEFPRYNFTNFGNSFMMIFRILCGKWIEPQWELLKETGVYSILFIFFVFVIGRWVVLNLFLALLLSSFGGDALSGGTDEDSEKPKKSRLKRLIEWTKRIRHKKKDFNKNQTVSSPEVMHFETENGEILTILDENSMGNRLKQYTNYDAESDGWASRMTSSNESPNDAIKNGDSEINGGVAAGEKRGHSSASVKIAIKREKTFVDDCLCDFCYKCSCCYTSYLNSPFRRSWHNSRFYCRQLIEHKYFEGIILFLIAFSSLTLVFEDVHLHEYPDLETFLRYCNYFFAIIFTLEFLIKLFALGFVKYFTNFWNLLDVFIVAISLASLFGSSNLKALRSLRGLRPLRAISRFEGMKVVVNALLYSIPSIANVLLVCMVFWLIFSIMGYNIFGGKFYYCAHKDDQIKRLHANFGIETKEQCQANSSYVWVNRNVNFDSSLNGFLALFQTATLEGWFEVMADAYDATEVDKQPIYRFKYENQIFFIVFIILGAFFILNLFIGVIIDNFNRLKQQYEDGVGIFLTPGQRNWINTLKAASLKKPSRRLTRPTAKWRAALFDFIHTKYFEFFIMSVILLNMLTMMIQHYKQPVEVDLALKYLNYLFTGIFTLEATIRLIAMRLEYFKYGMNVFDFIIVIFSIAVIIMEENNKDFFISPGLFRVVRVFRLGRLLRFFEGAKGIRKLLFTIVKSAPALSNIGTLLFLITFIYAIIAMNIFGHLKFQGSITRVVNFQTFGSSFCLLFRISTAAGWNGVLEAAMVQPPSCNASLDVGASITEGDCGHKLVAVIFFVSYIILIVLIIINMYIAVILENFNQAQSQDEAGITEDDIEAYYLAWEDFDPKATQFIKYSKLPDFINSLDGPLRVPKPNYWFLEQSHIAIKDRHRCHCLDVMTALIRRALGEANCVEDDAIKSVMEKVESRYKQIFPLWAKEVTIETTTQRLKTENAAARRIQRVFRRHLLMEEIHTITTTKNMSLRSKEKNLNKIEKLVTVMWKTAKMNEDPFQESEDEGESGDDLGENMVTEQAAPQE